MVDGFNQTMKGKRLTYGELLCWIGLWTMMSTVAGTDRHSFWSTCDIKILCGCFFTLSMYMSRTRFELILQHIKYAKLNPPTYKDRFWEVHEMLEEWNKNMATNFVPSWINCIDESMSKWLNEYTCPGFIFVPCKPWSFGNEYHDAGYTDSNIIWSLELREGKDRQLQLNNKQLDDLRKTVGTLLRLTEPVWGSGKVFILDSGFCILKAIIELQKKGIFAVGLIKKCRYWPKLVPGDAIISHFVGKEIGESDALQGELDGIKFHLVGMKEADYVMMFITTYGTLGEVGDVKKRHYLENGVKRVKTFQYPEVVHNHYKYRDVIDNHISFRMHPISMEETWMTMRWPNRVFCFLLAVTMVIVQNAATYFLNKPKIDSLQSRSLIAEALISNAYLQSGVSPRSDRKRHSVDHVLLTVHHFKKIVKGRLDNCKQNTASGNAPIALKM